MSRVSRAEVALGAVPIVDDTFVVESEPKPAPAKAAKVAAKSTESEESSE